MLFLLQARYFELHENVNLHKKVHTFLYATTTKFIRSFSLFFSSGLVNCRPFYINVLIMYEVSHQRLSFLPRSASPQLLAGLCQRQILPPSDCRPAQTPASSPDMHTDAADAAGFVQGQKLRVVTPYGAQEFFLNRDEHLPVDVVHAEHAWWFPEEEEPDFGCFRSNANLLFAHEYFDPDSGAEPLKCLRCRVEACAPAP
ncbi:MAG: hypothetical protein LUG19_03510 [Desulfovibrio sp.]|uniref:molybdopterin dinucleotide binding domain-containing protein n=1 Tax=Desulfovibrio sp. TaxID=885 RepID=UPI002584BD2C|nr:molybdopterin dinucleotide binding domain-containing protein [Desulfovibrio sp.]MCD7983307.1 hypothetical protein [Desulfovibrio sp.]